MINLDQVWPYWGGIKGISKKQEQEWRQAAGKKNRKEGRSLLVHITEIELQ